MLTNLSLVNRKSLLKLLNASLSSGFVPSEWKTAIVVPILKLGKSAEEPVSYRLISLTSCLAKLLEKIINKLLKWYLEKNGFIPKHQAGFRLGYTTTDLLVALENEVNTDKFASTGKTALTNDLINNLVTLKNLSVLINLHGTKLF
jgi:hypothetical protein